MFAWLWHWIIVPLFVMPFLMIPVLIPFAIIWSMQEYIQKPIIVFILHIIAFGWMFFNADNVLHGFGVPYLSTIVYVLLCVAMIDCFIEMLLTLNAKIATSLI